MAARPNPHSSLRVCQQLARNSIRRLTATIESTQAALDSNARLTPTEQENYRLAVETAVAFRGLFSRIEQWAIPAPARTRTPRKTGRPSAAEVARWQARKTR